MHENEESLPFETSHIDAIPPEARHGRARDLFAVWFSGNLSIGNAVFGLLAVVVGNSFWWAIVAILVGNVIGGVFMALHSVQGARLGVPQLIQSRGQFGFYGALLPVALAAVLYLGFFYVTAVLAGQALAAAKPDVFSVNAGIILCSLISIGLALIGYRAIHVAARWALWPLAGAVLVVTIAIPIHGDFSISTDGFQTGPFFTAVGLMATFLLTYAPYVSDYSRYLPVDTPARATFGWTFAGIFISATWCQFIGVLLAAQFGAADTFSATRAVIGHEALAVIVLLVTAVAIGGNNSLNLYGGMLNMLTAISSMKELRPSFALRTAFLLPTYALGLFLALKASADFYAQINNLLSFLMLGFVPWGAINLLDFYLVRHGNYDIPGFFDRRGTYYSDDSTWTRRGVNLQALLAYIVGVVAALPFVSNGWFKGWVAHSLGDADISWMPGLVVTGLIYLGLVSWARRAGAGGGVPEARVS
jgi:NCS1 family nucleobase:cation symporter-1